MLLNFKHKQRKDASQPDMSELRSCPERQLPHQYFAGDKKARLAWGRGWAVGWNLDCSCCGGQAEPTSSASPSDISASAARKSSGSLSWPRRCSESRRARFLAASCALLRILRGFPSADYRSYFLGRAAAHVVVCMASICSARAFVMQRKNRSHGGA